MRHIRFPLWVDPDPQPSFILVSDLDHTMVQNEDNEHGALLRFNRAWLTSGLGFSSMLVFSTGRSPLLYKELRVRREAGG